MDEKIRAKFFSRRFSSIQHTQLGGRNGKELEDDLFVDVDPMNCKMCRNTVNIKFAIGPISKPFEKDLGSACNEKRK